MIDECAPTSLVESRFFASRAKYTATQNRLPLCPLRREINFGAEQLPTIIPMLPIHLLCGVNTSRV